MIDSREFLKLLKENGVSFFTGVPDSLLQEFCACIENSTVDHIIAANEGNAVALAIGRYLASGNISAVYMQNSGLGNAVNPLISLADPLVYKIPILLIIGWRGEPGVKDEPQHVKQGPITPVLLDCLGIPYTVLPDTAKEAEDVLSTAFEHMRETGSAYALLVRKDSFAKFESAKKATKESFMTREEALETVIAAFPPDTIYISTTGKLSRELFELREKREEAHDHDFLTVGGMGHASSIALGISEKIENKTVVCLDGDGAALMHLGGLATIGARQPKNFIHIIFNNGVHESVGGQAVANSIDYVAVSKGVGYQGSARVTDKISLTQELANIDSIQKPVLIDCVVKPGSRKDLGRPTKDPVENKEDFQKFIRT